MLQELGFVPTKWVRGSNSRWRTREELSGSLAWASLPRAAQSWRTEDVQTLVPSCLTDVTPLSLAGLVSGKCQEALSVTVPSAFQACAMRCACNCYCRVSRSMLLSWLQLCKPTVPLQSQQGSCCPRLYTVLETEA